MFSYLEMFLYKRGIDDCGRVLKVTVSRMFLGPDHQEGHVRQGLALAVETEEAGQIPEIAAVNFHSYQEYYDLRFTQAILHLFQSCLFFRFTFTCV